jgi:hypothetical protein
MEGISILPHLISKDFKNNKLIRPIFLADENENKIREVVFRRGLWAAADTYPDSVKEKEVEWALLFSKRLKLEVEKFGYPWVEIEKNSDDLDKVLSVLGLGA